MTTLRGRLKFLHNSTLVHVFKLGTLVLWSPPPAPRVSFCVRRPPRRGVHPCCPSPSNERSACVPQAEILVGASEATVLWVALVGWLGTPYGVASSISRPGAIALATAIGLLAWVIPRPGILLIVLIASVFVQVIAISGAFGH
jgi:hypothetical protein